MEMKTIQPLRLNEWERVQEAAKRKFSSEIGGQPDRNEVKKTVTNPNRITWVIWVAVFVLFVLTVFTSIKVAAVAVPFSEKLLETLTDKTFIINEVQTFFTLATMLLFVLLATPSLIYFKLLDSDEEIVKMKEKTADLKPSIKLWGLDIGWMVAMFNLQWATPRIPSVVVIISIIWLVIVSGYGVDTDTSFWLIERWLPVLVEVGLAYTIGKIAESQTIYNQEVDKEFKRVTGIYEERMNDRFVDKLYLNQVSKYLFQSMFKLSRSGRKPNAWLETAPEDVQHKAVLDEYMRLTAGDKFAEQVLQGGHAVKVQTVQEQAQPTTKRYPPNGTEWTVQDMIADFRKRGLDPHMKYNQTNLDEDYGGTGYRSAYRKGAKKYFLVNH